MKIVLTFSVVTKEGTTIPNVSESFEIDNTDESRVPARKRYLELKASSFIANLRYEIVGKEEEHIVTVAFKTYDYVVKGAVKKGDYVNVISGQDVLKLKVLEIDPPRKQNIKYVYAEKA